MNSLAMLGVLAAVSVVGAMAVSQPGDTPAVPAKPEPMSGKPLEEQARAVEVWNAPGDMHALLATMAGDWDVDMTVWPEAGAAPMSMKATSANRMALGGKFLEERLTGAGGMPFETISYTGYNADAQGGPRFECVRMSSMVAAQMPEAGAWDAATRTLTLKGGHDVNGMRGTIRNEIVMESADRRVVTTYLAFDGYAEAFKGVKVPEYRAMKMVLTRKAK